MRVQPAWIGCGFLDCCFLISPEITLEKEDLCEHLGAFLRADLGASSYLKGSSPCCNTSILGNEVSGRGFLVKVQLLEPSESTTSHSSPRRLTTGRPVSLAVGPLTGTHVVRFRDIGYKLECNLPA